MFLNNTNTLFTRLNLNFLNSPFMTSQTSSLRSEAYSMATHFILEILIILNKGSHPRHIQRQAGHTAHKQDTLIHQGRPRVRSGVSDRIYPNVVPSCVYMGAFDKCCAVPDNKSIKKNRFARILPRGFGHTDLGRLRSEENNTGSNPASSRRTNSGWCWRTLYKREPNNGRPHLHYHVLKPIAARSRQR